MNKKNGRKVLGRGLSNLIPVSAQEEIGNEEIQDVSISSIKTNPFQPRFDFDEEEIRGLAESIKNQGLLQPVVVRKKSDSFEIISGERRFRAFKYLKKDSVPCIIKYNVTDREMLELALIENIQREELNEIEKALAYQKLLIEYNYTHEQLSEHIGKSRTVITNSLRLLNLPEEIQLMVRKNQISMGHARALLSFDLKDQFEMAQKIISDNLSVRDVEKFNTNSEKKTYKNKGIGNSLPDKIDANIDNVISQLQYKLGTSVLINNGKNKKGKISICFFSEDDLSRIIDILLK